MTVRSLNLLELSNVYKKFNVDHSDNYIIKDVSLNVKRGEFITILGQSGCGKSTLLNLMGGFTESTSGLLKFDGEPISKPNRRAIMLFQNYALLPWRTVLKNVELGLESSSLSKKERKKVAMKYIKLVGLEKQINYFPVELSGGMQQRVAIARALAIKPELILMDEPFAALDTFTRYYLQEELIRIQRQERNTVVLVTHDIDEAVYLSDRIFIMDANLGSIKKEIKIDLAKPRNRAHKEFQGFRKIIMEASGLEVESVKTKAK